jgi:hypothetical protein
MAEGCDISSRTETMHEGMKFLEFFAVLSSTPMSTKNAGARINPEEVIN